MTACLYIYYANLDLFLSEIRKLICKNMCAQKTTAVTNRMRRVIAPN